jgi:hypothetical protein
VTCTHQYLFIGGPLHGVWRTFGKRIHCLHYRSPDPEAILAHHDYVHDCLELREIKALTGLTYHRTARQAMHEEHAAEEEQTFVYRWQAYVIRRSGSIREIDAMVLEGLSEAEIASALRELLPG